MNIQGWAEIALTIGLAIALAWPLGVYMARIWSGQSTWLDPVLRPVERLFYSLAGVQSEKGQTWLAYAGAMLMFNAVGFVALYAILRLQAHLPLNPQGLSLIHIYRRDAGPLRRREGDSARGAGFAEGLNRGRSRLIRSTATRLIQVLSLIHI